MELNERVAKNEVQLKELDRRVADVEDTSKINCEMLHEFKIMNANVTSQLNEVSGKISNVDTKVDKVSTKFDKLETKVNDIEQKPQKLSLKAWIYIGCAVGGFIVSKLIDLVASVL